MDEPEPNNPSPELQASMRRLLKAMKVDPKLFENLSPEELARFTRTTINDLPGWAKVKSRFACAVAGVNERDERKRWYQGPNERKRWYQGPGEPKKRLADEDAIAMYVSDVNNLHAFIKGIIHGSGPLVRSAELMFGVREACRAIQAYLVRSGHLVPPDPCVNCEKPTEHGPGSLCGSCVRLG